ncbi:MAG: hypothetical protein QG596_178 [Actinomycetota bacterium]|jgi:RNase P subunit RPR2|nr:hypothetical protein [Actinomycetota bacterium]
MNEPSFDDRVSEQRQGRLVRLIYRLMPSGMRERAARESGEWMIRCEDCGREASYASIGGIRAGASGEKRIRVNCSQCGEKKWARVYRREPTVES